ncbi:MAG TPA: phosphoadenylyl-sulfate reductase [Candidatus Polarisedimenticolia bacterium]|nr:phosphoadenylyl-sulfate reductase [Candidatus Polarisedimenticolia bacterium]
MKTHPEMEEIAALIESWKAPEVLRWALDRFHPRLAFASSFGAEDVVVIDLLSRLRRDVRIVTLDTGRLHEETYDVMDRVRRRYGVSIEVHAPEREAVERLGRDRGFYSFRDSIEARKECCRVRKVEPLRRALAGLAAWMTGLRRTQGVTRGGVPKIEYDSAFDLIKLNPIADWSEVQVWDYIREHQVPYNALHDRAFPSIGCSPCTRAVQPGEDPRAGRWWWEQPEQKECGLHAAQAEAAGPPASRRAEIPVGAAAAASEPAGSSR